MILILLKIDQIWVFICNLWNQNYLIQPLLPYTINKNLPLKCAKRSCYNDWIWSTKRKINSLISKLKSPIFPVSKYAAFEVSGKLGAKLIDDVGGSHKHFSVLQTSGQASPSHPHAWALTCLRAPSWPFRNLFKCERRGFGRENHPLLSLLPARRLDCLPLGLNCAPRSAAAHNSLTFLFMGCKSERYTSFAAEGRPESMRNSIDFARLLQERCARFARINLAHRTNRKCLCTTGSFATGSKYSKKFRLPSQNNSVETRNISIRQIQDNVFHWESFKYNNAKLNKRK